MKYPEALLEEAAEWLKEQRVKYDQFMDLLVEATAKKKSDEESDA